MGLMDKLKTAKSNLTGDWADVSLQTEPATRGGTLQLVGTVTVKSQAVQAERIVLEVSCAEIVELRGVQFTEANGSQLTRGSASETVSLFDLEHVASGPVELASGSTTTYTGAIAIPDHAPPSFDGRNARYEWQARARIDMKGNDPDSGWQRITVS